MGLFAPVHLLRSREIQQVNTTHHSPTTSFNGNTHTCNEFMTVDPEQGVDTILSSYVSLVVRMWIINANFWFVATAFLRMTSQSNIVISGMMQNK